MNTEAISPLRQRMIEDMVIRQFGEHTKRDYIRQVREFAAFLGRSPDRAEPEDLRATSSASPRWRELLAHEPGRHRAPVLLPCHPRPRGVRRLHGKDPDA